jgi:hypothetical protein
MLRLDVEFPEEIAAELQRLAETRGMSVSRFLEELVEREIGRKWPEGFFQEVVGGWKGEPLERASQSPPEIRDRL